MMKVGERSSVLRILVWLLLIIIENYPTRYECGKGWTEAWQISQKIGLARGFARTWVK